MAADRLPIWPIPDFRATRLRWGRAGFSDRLDGTDFSCETTAYAVTHSRDIILGGLAQFAPFPRRSFGDRSAPARLAVLIVLASCRQRLP